MQSSPNAVWSNPTGSPPPKFHPWPEEPEWLSRLPGKRLPTYLLQGWAVPRIEGWDLGDGGGVPVRERDQIGWTVEGIFVNPISGFALLQVGYSILGLSIFGVPLHGTGTSTTSNNTVRYMVPLQLQYWKLKVSVPTWPVLPDILILGWALYCRWNTDSD